MRFLGHRVPLTTGQVDARFQGEGRTDLVSRHEGICLKHRAGFNSQKAYDKFAPLLRIENTINRPEAFTVYRTEPAPTPPSGTATPPARPHRGSAPKPSAQSPSTSERPGARTQSTASLATFASNCHRHATPGRGQPGRQQTLSGLTGH